MNIEFYRKDVYGNELMYVKDDEIGSDIAILTGRITITEQDIRILGRLGCTFTEVLAPKKG